MTQRTRSAAEGAEERHLINDLKPVNFSLYAVFEPRNVKVDEKPQFLTAKFQV